jgi:hypothetical protein
MLCSKLYFDIKKLKCFALSSPELTENTDVQYGQLCFTYHFPVAVCVVEKYIAE